jgi:hypothetical protein
MHDPPSSRGLRDPVSTKPGHDILLALGRYHFLTSLQLNRLLYTNRSLSFVYETLSALRAHGYVTNDNWIALRATGAPRKVWCLTQRGGMVLLREGIEGIPILHQKARRSSYALEHLHELNDVLITCELLAKRCQEVELLGWKHDLELRRHPTPVTLPDGATTSVIPDGWIAYGLLPRDQVACFAVEVDRGFENREQWCAKVRGLVAFATGNPSPYERAFGYKTLTVMVVVRPKRTNRLKAPAGRLQELKTWTEMELGDLGRTTWGPFFRFTTERAEEVAPEVFFRAASWETPFRAGQAPLLEGIADAVLPR